MIVSAVSYASYGSHHIFKGQLRNGPYADVYESPSVSQFGWDGALGNAIVKWTNLGGVPLGYTTDPSGADIKVYVARQVLPIGTKGRAEYFNDNGSLVYANKVQSGSNFDVSNLTIDHYNTMEVPDPDWRYNQAQRWKLMGHELGHALSLGHFEDRPGEHSGEHWMRTGRWELKSPSSEDIDHIKEKW